MKSAPLFAQTVVVFTVLLFVAADINAGDRVRPQAARMQTLFSSTKQVCFGRLVIDVPVSATVVHGPAYIHGPITRWKGEGNNGAEKLRQRLAKVEEDRYLVRGAMLEPGSMFGRVIDGVLPGQKLVFGRADSVSYQIESFLKVGQDLFVQEAESLVKKDAYTLGIAQLNMVARLLRPRSDGEIPDDSGLCIDGGFVAEPSQSVFEQINLGIRLKEFPDVHFSISTIKKLVLVESDALEPRLLRAEADAKREGHGAWYSRIKMFRRGARQLGNWKGFEVLARQPRQEVEGESHEFQFLSQGEPNNPLLPVLEVSLHTGVKGNTTGAVPPSITDDEAIVLWDKLIGSIRVRPLRDSKAEHARDQGASLGTSLSAGDICSRTGWWQCVDGGRGMEVEGEGDNIFGRANGCPPAVPLAPTTLWQTVRVVRAEVQSGSPSSWTLADRRRMVRRPPSPALMAAGKRAQARAPELPVLSVARGSLATTGSACTAAGWWQCTDIDAVDGVRWFDLGDVLPVATIEKSVGILEKMSGAPAILRKPVDWRFIRPASHAVPRAEHTEAGRLVDTPAQARSDDVGDGPLSGA